MSIQQLQTKLNSVTSKMEGMLATVDKENRDFYSHEQSEYDNLQASAYTIKAQLITEKEKPLPRQTRDQQPTADPLGHRSSLAVANTLGKSRVFSSNESAYGFGKWAAATLLGDEQSQVWCHNNGITVRNAGGEGIATKGGVLVPEQYATDIIRLVNEYSLTRQECRVVPMSSDTLKIPRRTGGLTAYFIGENLEGTESDTAWDNVGLTLRKLMVLTRMSSELNEDSIIVMADLLAEEISLAFAQKEDTCLSVGNGTSTYGGIVGLQTKFTDGLHTAGAVDVSTSTHNLFSELDAVDLAVLMATCPAYAKRNAKWYCSSTAYSMVFERLLMAANGATLTEVQNGALAFRYAGYPVVLSEALPNGATTDYDALPMIYFGDLRKAVTVGSSGDLRVMISEHRYFELDQVGVRGTERFDINVHDVGDTSTAGPLVALIGSAA